MHETSQSTLYHRFLKGEWRVDGWQSDWQKELKRRAAEEKLKPVVIAKNSSLTRR